MSENNMKNRILEELKKAKEAEQITTEKVSEIVKDAVSAAVAETKGGVEEIRPVVKDAVAAAVEGLDDIGADTKEIFEGAVEGAIAGACSLGDQAIEATRKELQKLETRLEDEKTRLAQSLREGLEGAKEAGVALSGDLRGWVESAVTDTKLKSTELLGLTRGAGKAAAERLKEVGKDAARTTAEAAGKAADVVAEEAKELGKKSLVVAKGAISGMWQGAKDALKKEKEE